MTSLNVRHGVPEDVDAVLELLDGATEWLVARGRTDQWGTEPHSTNPQRIDQIRGFAGNQELWIAETDDAVVGALAVGAAPPFVPPVAEPELYVRLLVTDRAAQGSGIGTELLDHARSLARGLRVDLLRVDCFAGGDGALVRYYEKQGFTRAEEFTVRVRGTDWRGQVLVERL